MQGSLGTPRFNQVHNVSSHRWKDGKGGEERGRSSRKESWKKRFLNLVRKNGWDLMGERTANAPSVQPRPRLADVRALLLLSLGRAKKCPEAASPLPASPTPRLCGGF